MAFGHSQTARAVDSETLHQMYGKTLTLLQYVLAFQRADNTLKVGIALLKVEMTSFT